MSQDMYVGMRAPEAPLELTPESQDKFNRDMVKFIGDLLVKAKRADNYTELVSSSGDAKVVVTATGVDMGTNKVTAVVDPVGAQDAATKSYVDTLISSSLTLIYRQDITTGSTVVGQVARMGWNYAQGTGGSELVIAITYGMSYIDIPIPFVTFVGYTGGAPSALSDFDSWEVGYAKGVGAVDITTTGFNAHLQSYGVAFNAARYYGFTWIAVGTPT